jgi:hypothetical protein
LALAIEPGCGYDCLVPSFDERSTFVSKSVGIRAVFYAILAFVFVACGGTAVPRGVRIDDGGLDTGGDIAAGDQGCDAARHSCLNSMSVVPCNTTNCRGCCQQSVCHPGIDSTVCGSGGQPCQSCAPNGMACVGQQCATACGAATCDGCCAGNQCLPGNIPTACGQRGASCSDCAALGALCIAEAGVGGACQVVSTCDPHLCPEGCCDVNGVCQLGETDSTCGFGGASCQICAPNQACGNSTCVPVAQDGGPGCVDQCNGCCDATGGCQAA